jgi:hypothetical protein
MEKISQSEASALIQTSVFSILGVELALMETFHKTSPTPRTILLCPGLLPKKAKMEGSSRYRSKAYVLGDSISM